ncbi:intramembrane serine protease GlpG [Methanosarcina sp. MTP4]|uniref:rhomboid family intramembrane serine protease n=1 Tax=Methanosarcina sp. MTP4 TaxID=1434100 RepID=UPI000615C4A8|nr:rhomboid family intramembrane serine protease [Methanosarcina sp. MTP4]AKB24165.1 intramembrane serine protease GlpG [Methanosarcina sp. MTP4]
MYQNSTPYGSGGTVDRIKRSVSTSPSMAIIAICVLSFMVELMPGIGSLYYQTFWFDPSHVLSRPWTLVTYIFLHNGISHLFVNMLVMFFIGRALEQRVGNKQLLGIFFTAGILSAVGHALMSMPIFGIYPSPIVGASGAIYGVFAALAVLEPDSRVYVYFIPMKLKNALVLFAGLDFLMIHSTDMVAHIAHLSGLFVGLYMGYRIKKIQERYWKGPRYAGRW